MDLKDWLISDWTTIGKVCISTVLLFSILIVWIRISGLRSFAKMSSIDFASTIAIGSVLASTILSKSPSLLVGALAIGFILFLQTVFSILTLKFDWFSRIASNQPLLLMDGETILYENLKATNLSKGDLMAKLREANVIQLSEVKAVILETTGDISVLHRENQITIDECILESVRK